MKTNTIRTRTVLGGVILLLTFGFQLPTAQGAHFLYTQGHGLDSGRLATFGGNTFTTMGSSDAAWAAAFAGAFGPFDAIVVGEGTPVPSAATRAAIFNYVLVGGRIIVISGHGGSESAFLNAVFGFSTVVAQGCLANESFAGALEVGATGTSFAGGPPTLNNGSCTTHFTIASRPPQVLVMYGDLTTDIVWARELGKGVLVWLGWDYCCTSPGNADNWYRVMDSALRAESWSQQIQDLIGVVNGLPISAQTKRTLILELNESILAGIQRPCDPTALSNFINAVNKAQKQRALTPAQATQLINSARAVRYLLKC